MQVEYKGFYATYTGNVIVVLNSSNKEVMYRITRKEPTIDSMYDTIDDYITILLMRNKNG